MRPASGAGTRPPGWPLPWAGRAPGPTMQAAWERSSSGCGPNCGTARSLVALARAHRRRRRGRHDRRRRRRPPHRHRLRPARRRPPRRRRHRRQHPQPRDPHRRPRAREPAPAGDRGRALQVLRDQRRLGQRVRRPRWARLRHDGPQPAEDPARPYVEPEPNQRGRRRLRPGRPTPPPRRRHLHHHVRQAARAVDRQPDRRPGACDAGQADVPHRGHRRRARPVPTAGLTRLPRRPALLPDARVLPRARRQLPRARRGAPPREARPGSRVRASRRQDRPEGCPPHREPRASGHDREAVVPPASDRALARSGGARARRRARRRAAPEPPELAGRRRLSDPPRPRHDAPPALAARHAARARARGHRRRPRDRPRHPVLDVHTHRHRAPRRARPGHLGEHRDPCGRSGPDDRPGARARGVAHVACHARRPRLRNGGRRAPPVVDGRRGAGPRRRASTDDRGRAYGATARARPWRDPGRHEPGGRGDRCVGRRHRADVRREPHAPARQPAPVRRHVGRRDPQRRGAGRSTRRHSRRQARSGRRRHRHARRRAGQAPRPRGRRARPAPRVGRIDPPVLEGRLPRDDREVAVGTRTLNDLGLHVGDSATLQVWSEQAAVHRSASSVGRC